METTTTDNRVECLARVVYCGSALAPKMGFETPIVRLILDDGREVVWHSANAQKAVDDLNAGDEVAVSAFMRGDRLSRVQLAKGCRIWGIGA